MKLTHLVISRLREASRKTQVIVGTSEKTAREALKGSVVGYIRYTLLDLCTLSKCTILLGGLRSSERILKSIRNKN